MEDTLLREPTQLSRYERQLLSDAETLRRVQHLLHSQPLWATVVRIADVERALNGGPIR